MDELCKSAASEPELGKDNPKFIALVKMFEAAIDEGIFQKDPDNENNILIYRTGMDANIYGISEGWCSQPVMDVAGEMKTDLLYNNPKGFESLKNALAEKGVIPQFTDDGDFDGLKKVKQPQKDIER